MNRVSIIIICAFALQFCKQNQVLLNKPMPNSEIAKAKLGDVIVSHGGVKKSRGKSKSTFVYWRLLKIEPNSNSIIFNYEEYYDLMKDRPDLTEERKFEIKEKLSLDQYELVLYQVSSKNIIYQVQIRR